MASRPYEIDLGLARFMDAMVVLRSYFSRKINIASSRNPVPRFLEARCPVVSGLSSNRPSEKDPSAAVRGGGGGKNPEALVPVK
jgi:hypothetical protein